MADTIQRLLIEVECIDFAEGACKASKYGGSMVNLKKRAEITGELVSIYSAASGMFGTGTPRLLLDIEVLDQASGTCRAVIYELPPLEVPQPAPAKEPEPAVAPEVTLPRSGIVN